MTITPAYLDSAAAVPAPSRALSVSKFAREPIVNGLLVTFARFNVRGNPRGVPSLLFSFCPLHKGTRSEWVVGDIRATQRAREPTGSGFPVILFLPDINGNPL